MIREVHARSPASSCKIALIVGVIIALAISIAVIWSVLFAVWAADDAATRCPARLSR